MSWLCCLQGTVFKAAWLIYNPEDSSFISSRLCRCFLLPQSSFWSFSFSCTRKGLPWIGIRLRILMVQFFSRCVGPQFCPMELDHVTSLKSQVLFFPSYWGIEVTRYRGICPKHDTRYFLTSGNTIFRYEVWGMTFKVSRYIIKDLTIIKILSDVTRNS